MNKLPMLLAAILLISCSPTQGPVAVLVSPSGEKVTISIEIADSQQERSVGLMNRTDLPKDHGMLFIFDNVAKRSFWMKNTLIPLDIIFFDEKYQYVSDAEMVPCKKDPCPSYYSTGKAKYALEVPSDFIETYNVSDDWTFSFMY